MNHKKKGIFYSIIIFMAFLSCSHLKTDSLKTMGEMGPREKAIFFMTVYNREYDAYKTDCWRDYYPLDDLKIMNEKLFLLIELESMINIYQQFIQDNIYPPKELENELITKTNRLLFLKKN